MKGKDRVKSPKLTKTREANEREGFLQEMEFTLRKVMKAMSRYISVKAQRGIFQKNSPRSFLKKLIFGNITLRTMRAGIWSKERQIK